MQVIVAVNQAYDLLQDAETVTLRRQRPGDVSGVVLFIALAVLVKELGAAYFDDLIAGAEQLPC